MWVRQRRVNKSLAFKNGDAYGKMSCEQCDIIGSAGSLFPDSESDGVSRPFVDKDEEED